MVQTLTEEFHEFTDHAFVAQLAGDGQHQVGRGRALRHGAEQTEANYLRNQ